MNYTVVVKEQPLKVVSFGAHQTAVIHETCHFLVSPIALDFGNCKCVQDMVDLVESVGGKDLLSAQPGAPADVKAERCEMCGAEAEITDTHHYCKQHPPRG